MKTVFVLVFFIFFSIINFITISYAQSNYSTVSDIDSFAYVTSDRALLILKRDSFNNLQYYNSVTIPEYQYIYSRIIDPYLFICTNNTLSLYSISDRENPVWKDEISLPTEIINIKTFGPYIVALQHFDIPQYLISVENDSLNIINYIERECNAYWSDECETLAFSYPYIFASNWTSIEMLKYDSTQNHFTTLFYADYRPDPDWELNNIISNSTNLCLLQTVYIYQTGFWSGGIDRYEITSDTIMFEAGISGFYGIPVIEDWEQNDRFLSDRKDIVDSRSNNYDFYLTNINLWNYLEPAVLTETNVYQPGSKLFYTQRITADSLIFKEYVYTPPQSVINDRSNLIKEYLISQNYPNPFNPLTTINYQIPERGFVTLKVYDVLGNEVETLISEEKPAGSYEIEWIASDLPSGIYYYQLRANNFVEIKKMVFIK